MKTCELPARRNKRRYEARTMSYRKAARAREYDAQPRAQPPQSLFFFFITKRELAMALRALFVSREDYPRARCSHRPLRLPSLHPPAGGSTDVYIRTQTVERHPPRLYIASIVDSGISRPSARVLPGLDDAEDRAR
jgi:hypothetical protein